MKYDALPRKVITILGVTPLSISCLRVTSTLFSLFSSTAGLASVKSNASFISFAPPAISVPVVAQPAIPSAATVAAMIRILIRSSLPGNGAPRLHSLDRQTVPHYRSMDALGLQSLHAGLSVCARLLVPPAAPVHPHRRCFLTKTHFDTVETTNRRRHRAQQARVATAARCDGLNEDFIWKSRQAAPRAEWTWRGRPGFPTPPTEHTGRPLPCTWAAKLPRTTFSGSRAKMFRNRATLLFQARPHGRRHGSKRRWIEPKQLSGYRHTRCC